MRKITGLAAICALASVISGCALQKAKGWDQYGKYMAAYDVLSADCLDLNKNDVDYLNYRVAASKLLTVMEIDSDLYNKTYKTIYTNSRSSTPEEKRAWCEKLRPAIVHETQGMHGDYELGLEYLDIGRRERAEAWANALQATAAIALAVAAGAASAASQPSAYQYYIPMPSGKVTFGSGNQSNYNHYLVNTPGGMRQCHVSSSNIVFCN